MPRVFIVSDIHYAGPAEQARPFHELRSVANPVLRQALRLYRNHVWLKNPLAHNPLLDRFLERARGADYVVANGDYACNSSFTGLSDDAAFESARICLEKLSSAFKPRFQATIGDHELGKLSLVGNTGGMRLESWRRTTRDFGIEPFWQVTMGNHLLIGICSSLVAFPVLEPESLPEERPAWRELRAAHLEDIRRAFDCLRQGQRVVLFCHDPTALPFLLDEEPVRRNLARLELTIIGHLHSPLVLWKSRMLSGMPAVRFLGNSVRKFSSALRQARHWKAFNVHLCPSLAGIELLKDGGFLELQLDDDRPALVTRHRIPR